MLIEPQFRTPEADAVWSAGARVGRMVEFEAALAAAQAEQGLVPDSAAAAIGAVAGTGPVDADAILNAAATAGNPAIPFVKAFTAAVRDREPEAAIFVHLGSTSQDVIDTALMLGLHRLGAAIEADLDRCVQALRTLAETHADTPMVARTLLQQATPVTFGFKAALWMVAVQRARTALAAARREQCAVQLGGASGSLALLGPAGPAVRAALARRLGLRDPGFCWHTLRDRVATLGGAFAGVVGAAAKIAGDAILMMQSEVEEAHEKTPGGSSAMPHKRNPVAALVPVAALGTASGLVAGLIADQRQEHERAAGAWHGEWTILPALSTLAAASAARLHDLVAGLAVDPDRMRANIGRHRGLLAAEELGAALAASQGRTEAHRIVEHLAARVRDEGAELADLAAADPRVTAVLDETRRAAIFHYEAPIAAAAAEARRLIAEIDRQRSDKSVREENS